MASNPAALKRRRVSRATFLERTPGPLLKPPMTQAAPTFRSPFLRVLDERGYIHQGTDLQALDAAALKGPITAYVGFDATAPSLHVGSLVQIMLLRHLQQAGHKPIVLMGG